MNTQENLRLVELLVVDDNEDDVMLIKEAFEEIQMLNSMNVVSDGEQALEYLRHEGNYSDAIVPTLVLLDINMPRKNGFEVLEEMKGDPALKPIPVIILTTSEREEDIVKAYSYGACSFIKKPVDFAEFVKVVKQFEYYWTLVARIPKNN